jgi:hypothetical protein
LYVIMGRECCILNITYVKSWVEYCVNVKGCKVLFEVRLALIRKIQFCIAFFVSLGVEINGN